MRTLFISLLLLPSITRAQVVEYQWLNQPCASILNCDTGCSACNLPVSASMQFFGNDVGWLGIDVCPHPIITGDNALMTYGWPTIPDEDHAAIITGIAFTPTRIDSVIIRHRAGVDGPQRLRVRFGVNESMPTTGIADVVISDQFTRTTLLDLGEVTHPETMVYGFFSIVLQPYEGSGGSWDLDDLRIVGTPMSATGIHDPLPATSSTALPRFDALGRPVLDRRSVRMYFDSTKRVVLEQ